MQFLVPPASPVLQPPGFYVNNLPPAPAGVEWWAYRPGVPLLPTPAEVLGANYSRCGWLRDLSQLRCEIGPALHRGA